MSGFISLKARILFTFGVLMIFLMLLISLSVLLLWRKLIINDQIKNTEAIVQSFSFSVLDAIIYQENGLQNSEGYLQSYISNYALKNTSIRYISVRNAAGKLLAHSDISALDGDSDYPNPPPLQDRTVNTRIFKHAQLGWIIETDFALKTGMKNWGLLQIAFDSTATRQNIRNLFFLLAGLTLVSVFVLLLVLYFFANRLTLSLSALVNNMDRFDLQKPDPAPLPVANDETGYLLHHFEKLKDRLNTSRQNLIAAQKQIYQAEKLASVGRLASGVAHEINNPLNGIKNCLYVLQRNGNDPAQREKYFPLIEEGLNTIEIIVRKLLNFSHKSRTEFNPVDMNKEIELVLSLLEYRLNEKQIQLNLNLAADIPAIEADAQLIQEVLMNILINAMDALPERGSIDIHTQTDTSNSLRLTISDNGPGIPAQYINKIFEPFYTTKEVGKGTGLGLSVSLGIIEAHNGRLTVESKPGQTAFVINLPVLRQNENTTN